MINRSAIIEVKLISWTKNIATCKIAVEVYDDKLDLNQMNLIRGKNEMDRSSARYDYAF